MTFILGNFVRHTDGMNSGEVTLANSSVVGGPAIFSYANLADTIATIAAANYFSGVAFDLSVNDYIFVTGSDASGMYQVSAVNRTVNPPTVSVVTFQAAAPVGTANILDDAVTYAKFQDSVGDNTLLGNPGGGAGAEFQEVTLGNGLAFSSTTLAVPNTNLIYTTVAITAAEFNGMYAAPKLLVAAPGANKLLVLEQMDLLMTFVSADYAAGGAVAVQYDSTVHGAGVLASNAEAAADFFAGVSTAYQFTPVSGNTVGALPFSTTVNKGLYLSNLTQAFTTGDSTFVAHIWYRIIPTV